MSQPEPSLNRDTLCPDFKKATLAQLVEQLIRNQQVTGSSPVGGSQLVPPDSVRTECLPLSVYLKGVYIIGDNPRTS